MTITTRHKIILLLSIFLLGLSAEVFAGTADSKIAFVSQRTGTYQIFTMDPDGSNQVNVSNTEHNDFNPAWSPNGSKIAFTRCNLEPLPWGACYLHLMNADGSNQVRIEHTYSSGSPHWSPDGTRLVFGWPTGITNTDGSGRFFLNLGGYTNDPEFSPDGRQIVYLCGRPCNCTPSGTNDEICTANVDGTGEVNLTNNPFSEGLPTFSPDGTKIAYFNYDTGILWVMRPDGSDKRMLAAGAVAPAWSPDANKIAFSREGDIWVMNADGTEQTPLMTNSWYDSSPAWQRVPGDPVAFDFDGDGKTDPAVVRDSTWFINPSTEPTTLYGSQFGLATDKFIPADFDGDEKTDLAVWRENVNGPDGYFYILHSSIGTFRAVQLGVTGDDPRAVGDWDGDKIADFAVYRAGEHSTFHYRPSSQPYIPSIPVFWGTAGDEPLHGDFDGDGRKDAAVYRPSTNVWYILQSSDSQVRYVYSGVPTDKRVSGDFDGDGKTDIAIYSGGLWAVLKSYDGQGLYSWWGLSTDTLVPGDYDGDGKTDFAVWRDGMYYVQQSGSGQPMYRQFGKAGDIPVASVYAQ